MIIAPLEKYEIFPFWNKNITKMNPKNGRKQEEKEIEEEEGEEEKKEEEG